MNYITSAPIIPKLNSCYEAVHKEIKRFLLEEYDNDTKNFDIDIAIENAIDSHNIRVLSSTGYKHIDIKKTDKDIINEVVLNIIKLIKRKLDKFKYCVENSLLLVCPNIILKSNHFIFENSKGKKNYTIPSKLIRYLNDNTILICVSYDYKDSEIFKKMLKLLLILIVVVLLMILDIFII